MQDKARAITKMNRKPPPNTDSIRKLLVRTRTRSIFHARTPSPVSDSSENISRKDEREDETQNSQEEDDVNIFNRNVHDISDITSPRDDDTSSRYSYSSDSDWSASVSEYSCRTEAETPQNSETPHMLVPHRPAGTRSMSLAPHCRGISKPAAMPRPPTSRRPPSMARPSSTSRPSLMPHPPSAQRVRAGRSPSIAPRTRTASRQSRAARRTVTPTGNTTRTQEPSGASHGESSGVRPVRQSMQENQMHEGDRMYMPDSVRFVGERGGASPSPASSDGWESMDSSQSQLPSRLTRRRRSRSREVYQSGSRPMTSSSNRRLHTSDRDGAISRRRSTIEGSQYEDFTDSRNSLNLSRYSPPECLHFNDSDSTSSADELKAETNNAIPPSVNMSSSFTSTVDDIKELVPGHAPSTSNTRSTVLVKRKTAQEMVEFRNRIYGPSTSTCQANNAIRIPDYLQTKKDDGKLPELSTGGRGSFTTNKNGHLPRSSLAQESVVPGRSAACSSRKEHPSPSSKLLSIERIPVPPKGPCPRKVNKTRTQRIRSYTGSESHPIPQDQGESGSGEDVPRKTRFSWLKKLKQRYSTFRR